MFSDVFILLEEFLVVKCFGFWVFVSDNLIVKVFCWMVLL